MPSIVKFCLFNKPQRKLFELSKAGQDVVKYYLALTKPITGSLYI